VGTIKGLQVFVLEGVYDFISCGFEMVSGKGGGADVDSCSWLRFGTVHLVCTQSKPHMRYFTIKVRHTPKKRREMRKEGKSLSL
jgi:hypothetical protein